MMVVPQSYLSAREAEGTRSNRGHPLVRVAFLPSEVVNPKTTVAVLVDVMRATSAIVSLLEQGATRVGLVADDQTALALAREIGIAEEVVLCGERSDGRVHPGFAFPPSPSLIRTRDLTGKSVVMRTANGTVAAVRLRELGVAQVLIGCLNQCAAAARQVLSAAATADREISIVCSGREMCHTIALDDVYTAGAIVSALIELEEGVRLHDSALLAKLMLKQYTAMEAFQASSTWSVLSQTHEGLADLEQCVQLDVSTLVPQLTEKDDYIFAVPRSEEEGLP
jgi:2-phosphosulfolactate phosphatase